MLCDLGLDLNSHLAVLDLYLGGFMPTVDDFEHDHDDDAAYSPLRTNTGFGLAVEVCHTTLKTKPSPISFDPGPQNLLVSSGLVL